MLRLKSATGFDGIPNQSSLNLPIDSLPLFLAWFNKMWASHDIPPTWNEVRAATFENLEKPPLSYS